MPLTLVPLKVGCLADNHRGKMGPKPNIGWGYLTLTGAAKADALGACQDWNEGSGQSITLQVLLCLVVQILALTESPSVNSEA